MNFFVITKVSSINTKLSSINTEKDTLIPTDSFNPYWQWMFSLASLQGKCQACLQKKNFKKQTNLARNLEATHAARLLRNISSASANSDWMFWLLVSLVTMAKKKNWTAWLVLS